MGCRCFSPAWPGKLLRLPERRGSCCCTGLWLPLTSSPSLPPSVSSFSLEPIFGSWIWEGAGRRSLWELPGSSEDAFSAPFEKRTCSESLSFNSVCLCSVSGPTPPLLLFLFLWLVPCRVLVPPCLWHSVGTRITRWPTMWTEGFWTTAASWMRSMWCHTSFSSSSPSPSSSSVSAAGRWDPQRTSLHISATVSAQVHKDLK